MEAMARLLLWVGMQVHFCLSHWARNPDWSPCVGIPVDGQEGPVMSGDELNSLMQTHIASLS